ncbi:hypothetical protein L444_09780 [Escherichia coli BIDMC 15]|nr:hypothetical protein L454_04892 [Escherichia coli BIDMC 19C]ETX74376.1 hypothetical protein P804_04932 [Escherichia coli BIDMC 43b]ETX80967.1 hypothetical protein P803_04730 [Escherichia coli BIDMC 43a]ETX95963.1 hypothetical protein L453_09125 [Escherichia coli BIDMC 19B]ETY07527.1 hypothetical protein L447_09311 [Escherichia coli BIDMC 17B]ETY12726.1 hypothetical protein L446_09126 [Escherichia coli BIDMC 17A]ETY19099.1 hypothetical protein L444_09780 [Escherichia coli BIDMC 15]ETY23263
MVEARYQGKPVSSLPEEAFAEGLSRSGLSPVLLGGVSGNPRKFRHSALWNFLGGWSAA